MIFVAPNPMASCCDSSEVEQQQACLIGGLNAFDHHPLDPLNSAEIQTSIEAVKAAAETEEIRDGMRFIEAVLLEPSKESVVALADAPGGQLPSRRARLILYNVSSNVTSIWIVSLNSSSCPQVVSRQVVPNVQPAFDAEEYALCEKAIKNYEPFIEAVRKRGVKNMSQVIVDPWCVGYFGDRDDPKRRLAQPLVFCKAESDCPMENGYAQPLEGFYILVDLQRMQVIEFRDVEYIPLPPVDPLRNYTPSHIQGGLRTDLKPLQILQPEGPSFRVNGYHVEWQKWNFRVGFTPSEGLVIHTVRYNDGSRGNRSIAYRLSFVEMVVPYGDPMEPHYRKNAFDAGEDGLGKNAHSLKRGCDCLGYIRYFDAALTNFRGGVRKIENAICMHEEDHGILWKHQDWRTGLSEVRRSRRLSLSFICTVANYEYAFFWHFYQDGKIEGEVKLTGILSMGSLRPGETRNHGTVIAPGLYAPVHQHFFVARMNMAVDCKPGEAANQVVEVNVVPDEAGTKNPHNNSFHPRETLLKSEIQAQRDCNSSSARHWIVRNTRTFNRNQHMTGYKLVPGSNCLPLTGKEAMILRRARFLQHNLWVTPFSSEERFPGGDFPNQNPRIGEGLASWTMQDRSLEEADIVLWYVFGAIHVPRLEDWPVMPVEHLKFSLMPVGFFDCSPALDVPPSEQQASTSRL